MDRTWSKLIIPLSCFLLMLNSLGDNSTPFKCLPICRILFSLHFRTFILFRVGEIDTLATDKTGTLTTGYFSVQEVIATDFEDVEDDMVDNPIAFAASLESQSSHPLASAIVTFYGGCLADMIESGTLLPVKGLKVIDGVGVEGWVGVDNEESDWVHCTVGNERLLNKFGGDTYHTDKAIAQFDEFCKKYECSGASVLLVAIDDKLRMLIAIMDSCRNESAKMIQLTKNLGISVVMLTGDQETTALSIASEVGIDAGDVKSRLVPADKLNFVQNIQESGKKVMMLGDGVNDAAALAAAHVGVAMGSGSSAMASVTAQIICLSDDIMCVTATIILSQIIRWIIFINIAFAFGVKLIAVILTVLGHMKLWEAILVDTISITFVLLTSLAPIYFWRTIWIPATIREENVHTAEGEGCTKSSSLTSIYPMYDPGALSTSSYMPIPVPNHELV